MSRTSDIHGGRPNFVLDDDDESGVGRDDVDGLGSVKPSASSGPAVSTTSAGASTGARTGDCGGERGRVVLGVRSERLCAMGLLSQSDSMRLSLCASQSVRAPASGVSLGSSARSRLALIICNTRLISAPRQSITQLVRVDVGRQGRGGTGGAGRGHLGGRSIGQVERSVDPLGGAGHCVDGLARIGFASVGDGHRPVRSCASAQLRDGPLTVAARPGAAQRGDQGRRARTATDRVGPATKKTRPRLSALVGGLHDALQRRIVERGRGSLGRSLGTWPATARYESLGLTCGSRIARSRGSLVLYTDVARVYVKHSLGCRASAPAYLASEISLRASSIPVEDELRPVACR